MNTFNYELFLCRDEKKKFTYAHFRSPGSSKSDTAYIRLFCKEIYLSFFHFSSRIPPIVFIYFLCQTQ